MDFNSLGQKGEPNSSTDVGHRGAWNLLLHFVFPELNVLLVIRPYLLSSLVLLSFSCGPKAKPAPVRPGASNTMIGDCATPESSGVLSDSPKLKKAPRDLNGDGNPEMIASDSHLCRQSNCFWNVFASQDGCSRYLGTIEGSSLEVLSVSNSNGFRDLRAWWSLPGGTRKLSQRYQYRERGYQLIEVLLCRYTDDRGVQCASEEIGKE